MDKPDEVITSNKDEPGASKSPLARPVETIELAPDGSLVTEVKKLPDSDGIPPELRKVFESASSPCQLILKSAFDLPHIRRLIDHSKGNYELKIRNQQADRMTWRPL